MKLISDALKTLSFTNPTNLETATKRMLEEDAQQVINDLTNLYQNYQDDFTAQFQQYLRNRWQVIQNSRLSYLLPNHAPGNALLFNLCRQLKLPIQALMPTLPDIISIDNQPIEINGIDDLLHLVSVPNVTLWVKQINTLSFEELKDKLEALETQYPGLGLALRQHHFGFGYYSPSSKFAMVKVEPLDRVCKPCMKRFVHLTWK